MKKTGLHPLLKGLPYWLYLVFAVGLAGILLLIIHLAKTISSDNSVGISAAHSVGTATLFSKDEASVKSLVEKFEVNSHTINVYRSTDKREEIYTGTYLKEWNDYFDSLNGNNNWTIVSESIVSKIKVVHSTEEKIIALACVTDSELSVDQAGKLLRQLPAESFTGAYVFVKIQGNWKIGSFVNISDSTAARKTYNAMPSDLQELNGPLSDLLNISCKEHD